jgi:hypothetical protein
VTTQKIDWHPLNKTNIRRLIGGASLSILAIRRDGKGYYGRVNFVGDGYVELTNGDHVQNLYFAASPTVFAVIDEPPAPSYKLGERRLPLEDKSNGT